jgi:bidirectional [NiFe] hydrogenase diaphorase subunit
MELSDLLEIAEHERRTRTPLQVRCCIAAGCESAGSSAVLTRLRDEVDRQGLGDRVQVAGVGCMRLCSHGPLVRVDPDAHLYQNVGVKNAPSIIAGLNGGTVEAERGDLNSPFFALQSSVVLENCGKIEPERVESYIAAGGYQSLHHALREMTPSKVIDAVTRSGLRGRGGAGYPTGVKWATVAKNSGQRKFVVCNADEGDPGAFMNRSVLESDPHRVLEGMAIAGYAVGASQGYIYVRGEYLLALRRLQTAIEQARRHGLLGTGIFSTPFDFRIDLRLGAGAYVCGEETAMMASIMGGRGTPTPRPPYPAEHGLWGMPTLLNNVETFANVPAIVRKGPEWFASIGTPKSPGTKVFCVTGKVANTGLVEVPLGTPMRTIVQDIAGGAPGSSIKAVQTGGPSGGCIPAELLDTPVDYESLRQLGSMMGSGGMIVMDQTSDMVDVARYFMEFSMDESCGKCVPCRAGTVQLHRLLARILDGSASPEEMQRLEALCHMVRDTSLCGLGQAAPNPTLSTLRYFRREYEAKLDPRSRATRLGLHVVSSMPNPIAGAGRKPSAGTSESSMPGGLST